jgi:hypothetical protein
MNAIFNLLRSLLLTSFFSFAAPTLLLGGLLTSLFLLCYVPTLEEIGQFGIEQILDFLATFGSGQPFEGLLVISLTCSLVGALFDAYVFYQQQAPRRN